MKEEVVINMLVLISVLSMMLSLNSSLKRLNNYYIKKSDREYSHQEKTLINFNVYISGHDAELIS